MNSIKNSIGILSLLFFSAWLIFGPGCISKKVRLAKPWSGKCLEEVSFRCDRLDQLRIRGTFQLIDSRGEPIPGNAGSFRLIGTLDGKVYIELMKAWISIASYAFDGKNACLYDKSSGKTRCNDELGLVHPFLMGLHQSGGDFVRLLVGCPKLLHANRHKGTCSEVTWQTTQNSHTIRFSDEMRRLAVWKIGAKGSASGSAFAAYHSYGILNGSIFPTKLLLSMSQTTTSHIKIELDSIETEIEIPEGAFQL